jgi:TPR repeat protein
LDKCREFLENAVAADDPTGQFFLGSMLMCGDAPFKEDKVRGRWLLEESMKAGNKDAEQFLATWDMKMTPQEAKKMLLKSGLKLLWERILPKKAAEDPDDNQSI